MNDELESQLRRALRPVEAPEGFTARLMSRLPQATGERSAGVTPLAAPTPARPVLATPPGVRRARHFTLPAALAATLVAAVMLGQHMAQRTQAQLQERELAEARAASRELMDALRVTSQKLDLAYQAVNNPPRSSAPGEENPS